MRYLPMLAQDERRRVAGDPGFEEVVAEYAAFGPHGGHGPRA